MVGMFKKLTALQSLWRRLPKSKLAGLPVSGHTRRGDRRYIRELVELRIGGRSLDAFTQDIGPDSMMVIVRTPVRERSVVQVRLTEHEEQFRPALVNHCTQAVSGFKVGLEFEKGSLNR